MTAEEHDILAGLCPHLRSAPSATVAPIPVRHPQSFNGGELGERRLGD
ncbi:MAG TPA: hypothetical protein VEQ66_07220 [Propionibacteriaceae bacterium]|nr:hypothetical protein [Propionibacteriaceae bacterium]